MITVTALINTIVCFLIGGGGPYYSYSIISPKTLFEH